MDVMRALSTSLFAAVFAGQVVFAYFAPLPFVLVNGACCAWIGLEVWRASDAS